jgi:uncharacterized membrane protein YebE (DUF533 family)
MALAAAHAPADYDDAQVAGLVRTAAPVLREALPSDHPANALIDRLVGAARSDGTIDERRLRRDLASVPTSVFFL